MRAPVGDAGLLPARGQAHRQKDMACSGAHRMLSAAGRVRDHHCPPAQAHTALRLCTSPYPARKPPRGVLAVAYLNHSVGQREGNVPQLQPVLPKSVPGFPDGTSGSCTCFPSLLCMGRKGRKGAASSPAQQHACQLPTAASATRTRSSLPSLCSAGSPGDGLCFAQPVSLRHSVSSRAAGHPLLCSGSRKAARNHPPRSPQAWGRSSAQRAGGPPMVPGPRNGAATATPDSQQWEQGWSQPLLPEPGWGSSHFFFAECTKSIFSLLNHLIFLAPLPTGILSFFCINFARFQR